jgi:hypothetical protein
MGGKSVPYYKLDNIEIVNDSLQLYKENYRLFLNIAFAGLLIDLINQSILYLRDFLGTSPMYLMLSLIMLVISLPLTYLDIRLSITLYICISKRFSKKSISFKQAFKISGESIWSYIGVFILYFIISLPFTVVGTLIYLYMKTTVLKWVLIFILLIPIVYLTTIYSFAPLATILEVEKTKYFNLSKKLVQGNLWRILVLLTIAGLITLIPGLLISTLNPWYKALGNQYQFILQVLHKIVILFISPLISTISTALYLTLRKKVIYKQ